MREGSEAVPLVHGAVEHVHKAPHKRHLPVAAHGTRSRQTRTHEAYMQRREAQTGRRTQSSRMEPCVSWHPRGAVQNAVKQETVREEGEGEEWSE